ncbi:SHOCT domain-containing protein [Desulfobotulus alkaliphilus]|uniref:SHOCT domain-containing protein n=1 Tax=Desulfobotulus alkaliphilus TaxID=622671 RepID=UPI0011A01834|nr:SHOCT domain-containing protein [Desulfobotulus alkaliphilus]
MPTEGIASSIFMAYGIVLLNVMLVAVIGLLVLFFRGIVHYMTWIFIAGILAVFGTGYYFLRRMQAEKRSLKEMLALPEFSGRNVEISLLGGFAALRMGEKEKNPNAMLQLESSEGIRVRELTELGRMYENELISREEYEIAKKEIFRHTDHRALPGSTGADVREDSDIVDVFPSKPENGR